MDPKDLADAFHRPAATPPTGEAASVPDQLERLAQLRDKGIITQAEFEAKKAELLGRL
jgi:hypothetical protein